MILNLELEQLSFDLPGRKGQEDCRGVALTSWLGPPNSEFPDGERGNSPSYSSSYYLAF